MKIIIAGSRNIEDFNIVKDACYESGFITESMLGNKDIEIVSGGARGVDYLGERFGKLAGFKIKVFPADWVKHGKAAGPIRNRQMGDYADMLIAIRLNNSTGTTNMIEYMLSLGKKVFVKDIIDDKIKEL